MKNKSIIIVDTPEDCSECILLGKNYWEICKAYDDHFISYGGNYYPNKPDWCPLSPLPPQLDLTRYNIRGDAKSMTHMMMCIHDLGWNDFRDKILEEK